MDVSTSSRLATLGEVSEGRRAGAAFVDFLYPSPAKRSVGGIFKWWEKRRLGYNAIVGAGGTVSLGVIMLVERLLGTGGGQGGILTGVIVTGLLANVCYTLGPVTESLLHKLWGRDVRPVGPHLFRAGLIFSVGLTFMLPMMVTAVRVVAWFVSGLLGLGLP